MNIRDLIPEYLLQDGELLAVYCDLVRRVQARPVKVMAQGKVIPLAGYELLESANAISGRVGLSAESVNSALERLSELDVIEEHAEGPNPVALDNVQKSALARMPQSLLGRKKYFTRAPASSRARWPSISSGPEIGRA